MTAFTFYQLAKTQAYEFIGNLFQFGAPGNDSMFNLIILFSELMFIGFAITYLLFEVFEVIIDEFSSDYKRMPSNFTSEVESFLDIFFLLFPTAVIIYILIPTLGFIYSEDLTADSSYALTITVVGHQWYWSYQYVISDLNTLLELSFNTNSEAEFDAVLLQQESEKFRLLNTDNIVYFPSNTRILLQITSEDVIHSWAVPQLGIKVDAVPGRLSSTVLYADIQSIWFGQCSELCGAYHAFMPICIASISPKMFFILWTMPSNSNIQLIEYDAEVISLEEKKEVPVNEVVQTQSTNKTEEVNSNTTNNNNSNNNNNNNKNNNGTGNTEGNKEEDDKNKKKEVQYNRTWFWIDLALYAIEYILIELYLEDG